MSLAMKFKIVTVREISLKLNNGWNGKAISEWNDHSLESFKIVFEYLFPNEKKGKGDSIMKKVKLL